jgi:radical SAM protein with 4Fe4S-binding SPASM domain
MQNWPEEYGKKSLQSKPSFFISQELYERNRWWNSCWFGRAAVTSNGDVLPCVFARRQVAGNVKRKSLRKIILGREMLKLWRLSMDHIEVCKDCEYRYVCEDCRPWAYGLTDNLCAKSPRCTYNPYTGKWGSVDGAMSSLPKCVGSETKASR